MTRKEQINIYLKERNIPITSLEANSIIDTAQNNADSIVREALSTARLILVDVSRLTSEISGMKAEVKSQLTTLQKSLDEFTIPPLPALEWLESQKLIEEERK